MSQQQDVVDLCGSSSGSDETPRVDGDDSQNARPDTVYILIQDEKPHSTTTSGDDRTSGDDTATSSGGNNSNSKKMAAVSSSNQQKQKQPFCQNTQVLAVYYEYGDAVEAAEEYVTGEFGVDMESLANVDWLGDGWIRRSNNTNNFNECVYIDEQEIQ